VTENVFHDFELSSDSFGRALAAWSCSKD
jgi:hypothetical protein